ncbi:MAG: asparaginase [Proteobacteria bacterium]|nr:asparaginase [Burkholderiales bacterium]
MSPSTDGQTVPMSSPRMVEVWRGPLVESAHAGVAAVANAQGEIIAGWGDTALVTYPRSALKPVQAIALVESGAYRDDGLTPRHLAIACASHRGEPVHSTLVTEWLDVLGLDQEALVCGEDRPADEAAAAAALIAGRPRQRIFHNCSGKHCGFLAVAQHEGWSLHDYDRLQHPAQQRYLDALSELTGADASALPFGVDGCALPAAALPVATMAVLMARFADARVASPRRRAAIVAIQEAMRAHPHLLSGTDQPAVMLVRATRGRIIMKTGAEGFLCAFVPRQGLGLALKITDGEARARVPALLALLSALGLLDASEAQALAALAEPPVLNSTGAVVGRIRANAMAFSAPPGRHDDSARGAAHER